MSRRLIAVGASLVLGAAALVAVDSWHDRRIERCDRESARLAGIDLLGQGPDGFRPDPPASGCDVDRAVAYATRQFIAVGGPGVDRLDGRSTATVDRAAVTAFYRRALEDAAWRISDRVPEPGPNAAALCASKPQTYVNVSFPAEGLYEVFLADHEDAGARCT
ncbi:hypothetical protein [Paractinoplanes lichenicola]|uniref:Secreted protein n=1 Tax=Paractinoplanes lichenicola TaxID=2802976 RepID=A0ABS1W3K8_9ACTN|nr:hypothetical protein [Actinoplanes lichenicola]MBL7261321.1 hypothetical protein [Actinoplanes lichenicola]